MHAFSQVRRVKDGWYIHLTRSRDRHYWRAALGCDARRLVSGKPRVVPREVVSGVGKTPQLALRALAQLIKRSSDSANAATAWATEWDASRWTDSTH